MTVFGTFLRRNFEPVVLSVQVVVDVAVVLFACWVGWILGQHLGGIEQESGHILHVQKQIYRELFALIAAVCLVTFHAFGMYSPVKSLLNMEEFKAVAKSTLVSFLLLIALILYLRSSRQGAEGPVYGI